MTEPPPGVDFPDSRSELSSLVQAGLGHTVDDYKLTRLAMMREHLEQQIDRLSDLLMDREITPTSYLERLDEILIEASKTGESILGFDDFHRVFGELRSNRLGDAKLFLEQYAKGH
jgi:hypothetical protein